MKFRRRAALSAATAVLVVAIAAMFIQLPSSPAMERASGVSLLTDWWQVGSFAAGGCAAGAALGAAAGVPAAGVGALPGAAFGCAIGAVIGGYSNWYGQNSATASDGSTAATWVTAEETILQNGLNYTSSAFHSEISMLNRTTDAFDNMAAAAALSQLGNKTFNPYEVLDQGGINANLAQLPYENGEAINNTVNALSQWYTANYGPNGRYGASTCTGVGQECMVGPEGTGAPIGPVITAEVLPSTVTIDSTAAEHLATPYVWIPKGTWFEVAGCSSTATLTLTSVETGTVWGCNTADTNGQRVSWNYTTGTWHIATTGTPIPYLTGPGLFDVPTDGTYGNSGTALLENECHGATTASDAFCTSGGGTSLSYSFASGLWPSTGIVAGFCNYGTCTSAGVPALLNIAGGNVWYTYNVAINNVEQNAMNAAYAYWAFLRAQGYTSEGQIPADCIIPMPNLEMAGISNVGNLSAGEALAFYTAEMNDMATFFNTNLTTDTAAQWCAGHAPFSLGNQTFSDVSLRVTGDAFLPTYGGQSPTNTTTWYLQKFNGTLWPSNSNVTIPVGKRFEPSASNPINLFDFNNDSLYVLRGNATGGGSINVATANDTAGAQLYITSCTVSGVAQSNCSLGWSNFNVTAPSIGCAGQCQPPPPAGGGFTWSNPFAALGAWFCGLPLIGALCFGGSGIASLVFAVLFLIAAALAVLGMIVWGTRRALGAGKSRGGSGSGGDRAVAALPGSGIRAPRLRRWRRGSTALRGNSRGAGAAQVVLLVFGLLFALSGAGLLAEGLIVSSVSSNLGGTFGNLGTTEEATGALFLLIGILLVAGAVLNWNGKRQRKRAKSR